MKKTERNILRQDTYCNLLNNISEYTKAIERVDLFLISKRCDLEDGFVFTKTKKLSFEETIIDVYFMVEEIYMPIYLFTKKISLHDFVNGWTQIITYYTNDNVFSKN